MEAKHDAVRNADKEVQADLRARNLDVGIGESNIIGLLAEGTVGAIMIINNPTTMNHTLVILAGAVVAHVVHFGLSKLAARHNNNRAYGPGGSIDRFNKVKGYSR